MDVGWQIIFMAAYMDKLFEKTVQILKLLKYIFLLKQDVIE